MIGEASQGGAVAMAYAGRHSEAVRGAINFVAGWMGEQCVPDVNGRFFSDAARTAAVPMLWLYAERDPYGSASAIRHYRAAFEQSEGQGRFDLFPEIGGDGHSLVNKPLFWRPAPDVYLQEPDLRTVPSRGGDQGHCPAGHAWRAVRGDRLRLHRSVNPSDVPDQGSQARVTSLPPARGGLLLATRTSVCWSPTTCRRCTDPDPTGVKRPGAHRPTRGSRPSASINAAGRPMAEAIESTRIHRVAGLTGDRTAVVTARPCRAPHHTISAVGGSVAAR